MFNIKISKRKYIFISSLLIIVTVIASILFFNRESQKNFLAIIEVKFIKSIDHIFLPPESSGTLQQYAVQYLNNLLPEYEWSLQGEIIIAKKTPKTTANIKARIVTYEVVIKAGKRESHS